MSTESCGGLPMSDGRADCNLLFAVLALQMNFVTRESLLEAMSVWLRDKNRPLGEILCERDNLSAARRELIEQLVREHVAQHGGDTARSLVSLNPTPATLQDLQPLTDPEIGASVAQL